MGEVPGAGVAYNMPIGWIWVATQSESELSAILRADAIVLIDPKWDVQRDCCIGCLIWLANGLRYMSSAMPYEIEEAIVECIRGETP